MTLMRLAWRLQRWELTLLLGAALALTGAALVLPSTDLAITDARAVVLLLTLAAPIVMGSVLGAGMMTDELQRGTARISWPLAIARRRWLWLRAWPVAVFGVFATLALGAAATRLMDLTTPSEMYLPQMRGPIVAVHYIAALTIGLLVGSILRRGLPAVLVSLIVVATLLAALVVSLQPWMREQAVLVPFEEHPSEPILVVLDHEFATVDSDGTLVVSEPTCNSPAECQTAYASMTPVVLVVPGDAYWPLLGISTLGAGLVVLVAGGATVGIITRWGPG